MVVVHARVDDAHDNLARSGGQVPRLRGVDIGIGTGLVAREAVKLTGDPARVVGVDPSVGMMSQADLPGVQLIEGRAEAIPFPDASFDFLSMGYALRHISDIDAAFREFHRVLKPGGWFIHLFPGRNAPFAVASRLLPDRLKQRLVHGLHPETVGTHRFHTWYDRCYSSAFRRLLEEHGFTVEQEVISYYQSHYFGFFVPLYLLSILWEFVLMALRARDSAATLLFVDFVEDGYERLSPRQSGKQRHDADVALAPPVLRVDLHAGMVEHLPRPQRRETPAVPGIETVVAGTLADAVRVVGIQIEQADTYPGKIQRGDHEPVQRAEGARAGVVRVVESRCRADGADPVGQSLLSGGKHGARAA